MNFLHSIALGAVEGITEFLPISSTGHLILTSHILKIPQTEFLKTFQIAIQLGAIFSIIALYFKTLTKNLELIKKILVAFLPTAVIGLTFYKIIKNYLFENDFVIIISLFFGGVFLILFERSHKEKPDAVDNLENISYQQSFKIGLFQSVAVIPGVSRAAATILGGLSQNIKRKVIVEFSFLLAIPTMLAATGLELFKNAPTFTPNEFQILVVGFITAFFVAIITIKFLLKFIQEHNFTPFGIYRIFASLIFLMLLF
ncbi:MAG: undecaprenyl-diphosphate phosphatase [Patescibacteria group bacterium]